MPATQKSKQGTQGGGFRFLSIGECMVELAPAAAPDEYRMGFAGDTFNTAWHLRQLRPDARIRYFSKVGTDAVSDNMLAMMTAARIDTTHVSRTADRSVGLYLISLSDGERSFSYWRDSSAAKGLAEDPAALAGALADTDIAYFSGITLAILDAPGRSALLAALAAARANGVIIAFDTNLRPRLWTSPEAMRATVMAAAQVADIALPSFDDEAVHFGDADPAATAARYLSAGVRTVVVKNGAGPVTYVDGGTTGTVAPEPVARVVDTTAAGDSFNAGFFAGFDGPASVADRIRFASRVAGQVIGQKGALVPVDPGADPSGRGV